MSVLIRKFEKKDIPNKILWINDDTNNQYLHYDLPLEYEKTCRWYEANKNRTDRYDAVIEYNGIPVGLIGLLSIDKKNSKAEYYITMGSHKYKGKGIAKEASKQLLRYAFEQLNLNRVYLYTEVGNIVAQKLFEKVGFKREGLLVCDINNRGKFVDRYIYGICKKDFYSNKLERKEILHPTEIIKSKFELQKNNLYIKRDDLFPFSFGGNKARKAILFFEDLISRGCDCIVTYGSSSSNHCRIIANMAVSRNLTCYIISPLESNQPTVNSRMIDLFDAELIYCPVANVSKTIDNKLIELKAEGKKPYFIPGGGHGNIGTHAYVNVYQEILDYEKSNGIYFEYIIHASGTGTTQAGLICGKIINDDNERKIIGISIARKNPHGGQIVLDSVNKYLEQIGRVKVTKESITFIDDYILNGYGSYNNEVLQTIRNVMIYDGIPMDTTYTGKAFWGMQNYIKRNLITGKNILFIHTGGTPLFFDNLEKLANDTDMS